MQMFICQLEKKFYFSKLMNMYKLTYNSVKLFQTTSSEERRHADTILQQQIYELNTILYQSFKHSTLQRRNLTTNKQYSCWLAKTNKIFLRAMQGTIHKQISRIGYLDGRRKDCYN